MRSFGFFLASLWILIAAGCAQNPVMPVIDDEVYVRDNELDIEVIFNFDRKDITVYNENVQSAYVWIGREVRGTNHPNPSDPDYPYLRTFEAWVPGRGGKVSDRAAFDYKDNIKMRLRVDQYERIHYFSLGEKPKSGSATGSEVVFDSTLTIIYSTEFPDSIVKIIRSTE